MKLREFVERLYISKHVKASLRFRTFTTYRSVLDIYILPSLGGREMESIRKLDYVDFANLLRQKKLSPKTIANHQSVLRSILKMAQEWEILARPAPTMKTERVRKTAMYWLNQEEEDRLLAAAKLQRDYRWPAMVHLILKTGIRIGEVKGLEWKHFSCASGRWVLHVKQSVPTRDTRVGPTKTGHWRDIVLQESTIVVLKQLHHFNVRCQFVFGDLKKPSAPVTDKACRRAIERIRAAAGLPKCGWHTLRHTVASKLANNPAIALPQVQQLLGHMDLKTTMRYMHVDLSLADATTAALEKT